MMIMTGGTILIVGVIGHRFGKLEGTRATRSDQSSREKYRIPSVGSPE